MLFGISMLSNPVQFLKANCSNVVMVCDIFTSIRFLQFLNAFASIFPFFASLKLSVIFNFTIPLFSNEALPIFSTLSGK